ncbi:MAG: hypothetical protein ACPGN3_12925 [Opitutales bacterium]
MHLTLRLLFAFLLSLSVASAQVSFWYEDNNMQRAGGYPEDFEEMFTHPDSWKELRSKLSVYYIRGSTLRNIREDLGRDFFVNKFCKLFIDEGLPVAIDNPGEPRHWGAMRELVENGVTVSHIGLQSILSKFGGGRRMTEERQRAELLRRIADAASKLSVLKESFPNSKTGLICALPTKGLMYEWAYRELMKQSSTLNAPLEFIHVDCPAPALMSGKFITWDDLGGLKQLIKGELRIEYGFIITDGHAGRVSNRAFNDAMMNMAQKFPAEHYPDYFIMMSWFPFPKYSVRVADTEDGAFTMTRTSLDFINAISNGGDGGSGIAIGPRDWRIAWQGRNIVVNAIFERVETGQVFLRESSTGRVAGFHGNTLSEADKDYVRAVLGIR